MKSKLSISRLKKIIFEEADVIINYDDARELEPREDAWSGGENLSHSLDIPAVTGGLDTTTSPEILSIVDDRGVYRVTESKLRSIVRRILKAR